MPLAAVLSLALALAPVAMGAPPVGWKTCGGLPDAYANTACPATQTCTLQKWEPVRLQAAMPLAPCPRRAAVMRSRSSMHALVLVPAPHCTATGTRAMALASPALSPG